MENYLFGCQVLTLVRNLHMSSRMTSLNWDALHLAAMNRHEAIVKYLNRRDTEAKRTTGEGRYTWPPGTGTRPNNVATLIPQIVGD